MDFQAHERISRYEASLPGEDRKRRGIHYTPLELARWLVDQTLDRYVDRHGRLPRRICDPTCGGGTFLLAAAEAMLERGAEPGELVAERLFGADLDTGALEVARVALNGWAEQRTGQGLAATGVECLIEAEALAPMPDRWVGEGFDIIVGNPPFLTQLRSGTTRSAPESDALKRRFGVPGAYADSSALILLAATELLAPGGIATLIQPQSFLSARDAKGVRDALLNTTDLVGLWSSDSGYFDASVRVCAVTVIRPEVKPTGESVDQPHAENPGSGTHRYTSHRLSGAESVSGDRAVEVVWGSAIEDVPSWRRTTVGVPEPGRPWGPLFAEAIGLPSLGQVGGGQSGLCLGDLATATAGFRDEFYALVEASYDESWDGSGNDIEAAASRRLITVGMVDPCRCSWGIRERRLGGVKTLSPRVDLQRLTAEAPKVAKWAGSRSVPKVLVATQTKVIEAWVDESGECVPVTPLISVEPKPGWSGVVRSRMGLAAGSEPDLWWLVAALSAPSVAVKAVADHMGTGLSGGALRVSARSVLDFEMPIDAEWWGRGAQAARHVAVASVDELPQALSDLGSNMCLAYGHDPEGELFKWWLQRAVATCLT